MTLVTVQTPFVNLSLISQDKQVTIDADNSNTIDAGRIPEDYEYVLPHARLATSDEGVSNTTFTTSRVATFSAFQFRAETDPSVESASDIFHPLEQPTC